MNLEMIRKSDHKQSENSKEAEKLKENGNAAIKTSCICCKFKPDFDDAIPYYKRAADLYHSSHSYTEEIYCREKLVYCFQNLKSFWEEGKENEKIGYIYLSIEKYPQALIAINNAYQSYFIQPDYRDAIECVKSFGHKFYEKNEIDTAEKCLTICYNGFLNVFHTLATKKDEPYKFLYEALDDYLALLFCNNKVRLAIEACQNVLTTIEDYENDKSNILHVYGFLIFALIVNEEDERVQQAAEDAKKHCRKNEDYRYVENILAIWEDIKQCQVDGFKYNMEEFKHYFPHEVVKKLYKLFEAQCSKVQHVKGCTSAVIDTVNYINKFENEQPKENAEAINGDEMIIVVDDKLNEDNRDDFL